MPEGIGYGVQAASASSAATSQRQKVAEQVERISARKEKTVAAVVQRQASFSANRAETLTRQAEKAQDRVESREARNGLGLRLDVSV
ncbi:hypothetical protein [Roseibium aggregatum]|uniref:Uncharacterized protein n=1 Tax=Roseibium aggregatum TaxID=187304 RepID=A0A926P018_9HYPH|nr:hypothetical protein [Roseibium aggregatum]MBD1546463.1 hypothetical protein [Roseibium aggregatum]